MCLESEFTQLVIQANSQLAKIKIPHDPNQQFNDFEQAKQNDKLKAQLQKDEKVVSSFQIEIKNRWGLLKKQNLIVTTKNILRVSNNQIKYAVQI